MNYQNYPLLRRGLIIFTSPEKLEKKHLDLTGSSIRSSIRHMNGREYETL